MEKDLKEMQTEFQVCLETFREAYGQIGLKVAVISEKLEAKIHEHDDRVKLHREEMRLARLELEKEKQALEDAKAKLNCVNPGQSDILSLDVGGKKVKVSQLLVTSIPDSELTYLFSDPAKLEKTEAGDIFVNRNGKNFNLMLDYLRNDE